MSASVTMASLFDGIGGFPKAGERYGIKTLWASEVEPFPISVTKIRFPDMANVGDITKLKGAKLPPVDIVCGVAASGFSIPGPPGGRWESSGAILGDEFSIAWRVVDAQYWFVPQRRKRIVLVAENTGCLTPWDTQQARIFTADGIAPTMADADGGGGRNPAGLLFEEKECLTAWDVRSRRIHDKSGVWPALYGGEGGAEICEDLCPTITSAAGTSGNNQPVVFENHGKDSRYTGPNNVVSTISAYWGNGRNNCDLTLNPHEAETYVIAGNIIGRKEKNGGNGFGVQKGSARH